MEGVWMAVGNVVLAFQSRLRATAAVSEEGRESS
jgi:hypothetical protein